MRISTSLAQQLGVNAILNQQSKLSKTQNQLSTGLRINTPSDDPVASVRVLDIQQSISQNSQYQSNIDTLRSRLTFEEDTLNSTVNAIQRVRELAVQGLNSTNFPNDRSSIAIEIRQIADQLVGLANTKNANGEYLFAGYRSRTPPFVATATEVTQDGVTKNVTLYQYQGDENQRGLQINPTRRIADGNNGIEVFGQSFDYIGNPPTTVNPSNPTEGSLFDVVTRLAEQLEGDNLDPAQITTTGAGLGIPKGGTAIDSALLSTAIADQTITVTAPDGSLQTHVIDLDTERSAASIALNLNGLTGVTARANPNQVTLDVSLTSGIVDGDTVSFVLNADSGITAAVSFVRDSATNLSLEEDFVAAINLAGLGDLVATVSTPNRLTIGSASGANIGIENFSVLDVGAGTQTIEFDNTTLTEGGLVDSAVRTSTVVIQLDDSYTLQSDVSGTSSSGTFGVFDAQANVPATIDGEGVLDDLDIGLNRILNVRASIGARINTVDLQQDLNADFDVDLQSLLSDTRDLDYTQAISEFNLQLVGLQAAQQAFVRVQDLSLFNFL